MVDFKGVFQGYQLIDDEAGKRLVMRVNTGDKLVSVLATEEPTFFSYYCEGLALGERVCISGSPKWQSDDAASLEKGDLYISRVSRKRIQPDGRGGDICDGYCEASERNEEEFGRFNVCAADSAEDSPAFPPDAPLAALIRFVVSQEDIDGDEGAEGTYCPIETAARRIFGVADARVSEGTLVIGNDVYNLDGVALDFLEAFYKYGAPYAKPFEIVTHLSERGI